MKQKFEAIKFDIKTERETVLLVLMLGGIGVGVAIVFIGLGLKRGSIGPIHPNVVITGIFIALISLIVFGLLRYFTDDYLMIEPDREYILEYNNFLFWKKIYVYSTFNEVDYIKLNSESIIISSRYCTSFTLTIYFSNTQVSQTYTKIVSMPEELGYQFNKDVSLLRDKALQIADMIGCDIIYTDKIPPKERLKPKSVINNQPSVNNMKSNFSCSGKEKICQSCGEESKGQNKYCNSCGREF